jgi:hypothetical protein
MMRRRRIHAADGLTVTDILSISSTDWTAEDVKLLPANPVNGLPYVESVWRPHAPPAKVKVRYQSLPWYAREILWRLERVKRDIASQDPRRLDSAAHGALHIGELHGVAFLRFGLGAVAHTGIKRRTQSQHAGKLSGASRRARGRDPIETLAKEIRRVHPYDQRLYSTRKLALTISHQLKRKYNGVRSALRDLGIK